MACCGKRKCKGGGFLFCPGADYHDGVLDICVAGDHSAVRAQEHHGHGLSDYVAATDHRADPALDRYLIGAQHLHYPRRGAGQQHGLSRGEPPDVHRMERVHVLLRGDRLNYRVLVDVLRQRQLNEYAVYLRIAVQRGDKLKQCFLRDGIVKFIFAAHKAALLTVALLTGDVYA